MRRMLMTGLLAVAGSVPAWGQEVPARINPKRTTPDPNFVHVQFRDGSHLKMRLMVDSVEVMTKYGKMSVPTTDIRRMDFGLRIPSSTLARVDAAVAHLHDPKRSEAARREIRMIGEFAIPTLREAAKRPHASEVRSMLDELRQRLPSDHFQARLHDTVTAYEFALTGKVEAAAFKARSAFFGEVILKLEDVRTIRSLAAPDRDEITVDAAKFGTAAQLWLDSGIDLTDEPIRISAAGLVDLYPLGGEKGVYMATPSGHSRLSRQTPFPSGALIGRIGGSGRPFLVGERYDGSPGAGRLYFRIEVGPWQVQPLGSYTVRVATSP